MFGGSSKYDKLGQQLERAVDPIAYDLKASIQPDSVHPEVAFGGKKDDEIPKLNVPAVKPVE